jgi:hypothetical protein
MDVPGVPVLGGNLTTGHAGGIVGDHQLAPTSCQASSSIVVGSITAAVIDFLVALLSFVDSTPRA